MLNAQKLCILLWPAFLAGLTGCQSPATVRLSDAAAIRSIQIAALEAPPLEVHPDLIAQRMPVVLHNENMALPGMAEETLYLNAGGILTAGKVGFGEELADADLSARWKPAQELAAGLQQRLQNARLAVQTTESLRFLPLAAAKRNANVGNWLDAVERWYDRSSSETSTANADAVLEIGIGRYRIFEDQLTLQVLVKLIDARSGKVLAKSAKQTRLYAQSAASLLFPNGSRFKAVIREQGTRLAEAALQDIGLIPQQLSSR